MTNAYNIFMILLDINVYCRGVLMSKIINIGFLRQTKKVNFMDVKKVFEMLNTISPKDLLYKYNLDNSFPVDIRALLDKLDIKVIPYDFSNLEKSTYKSEVLEKGSILGAVVSTDEKIGIFYNKYDSETRIRFTLAHELAHCCLHPDDVREHIEFRSDDKNPDKKEKEANIFAGELLIPEEPLRYAVENLINLNIDILTQIFAVSSNVMNARLEHLNIKIGN